MKQLFTDVKTCEAAFIRATNYNGINSCSHSEEKRYLRHGNMAVTVTSGNN
jgi:hypothetical protein